MMNKRMHKTRPELWKQVEALEKKIIFMENFLEENGLLVETTEDIENPFLDLE